MPNKVAVLLMRFSLRRHALLLPYEPTSSCRSPYEILKKVIGNETVFEGKQWVKKLPFSL